MPDPRYPAWLTHSFRRGQRKFVELSLTKFLALSSSMRGVRWYLVGSLVLVALIALAGCSHYMLAEREPWRHDAEIACLNSGAVKESPTRVRISSINGPGACGVDYPLRVSALGESGPLGYTDEAPVPPGAIPNASLPQHWPLTQPSAAPSSSVSSQPLP